MTTSLVRRLGVGTTITTLAMALQPLGCAADATSSEPPKLQSNWLYIASDGNSGTALDITPDNKYVLARLRATSATTFDAQVEVGTIAVAGSVVTFTPTKSSCRWATSPPYTANHTIGASTLNLAFSWGVVLLKLNTASGDTSSGLVLTNGCFQEDESFVPTELTDTGVCSEEVAAACSSVADCCRGLTCVKDGVCASTCTKSSDCNSGCCPTAKNAEGLRGCSPAAACK